MEILTRLKGDGNRPGKGEWAPVDPREWNGAQARVGCPKCGTVGVIGAERSGHMIDKSGIVTPSIVCPNAPCDWHVFGKLGNWSAK